MAGCTDESLEGNVQKKFFKTTALKDYPLAEDKRWLSAGGHLGARGGGRGEGRPGRADDGHTSSAAAAAARYLRENKARISWARRELSHPSIHHFAGPLAGPSCPAAHHKSRLLPQTRCCARGRRQADSWQRQGWCTVASLMSPAGGPLSGTRPGTPAGSPVGVGVRGEGGGFGSRCPVA